MITRNAAVVPALPPAGRAALEGTVKLVSVVLVLALTFQSVPLPIPAQMTPLSSMVGAALLPIAATMALRVRLTPLASVVLAFVLYTVAHSIAAVFVDMVVYRQDGVRVVSWVRQLVSLFAGVSVFWILRVTLRTVPDRLLARLLVAGALPAVAVGLLNVAWGAAGVTWAGRIVVSIREALAPLGYTDPNRASGLSLEPSHLGLYLAVVVIPVTVALLFSERRPAPYLALLAAMLCVFGWTFSGSAFLIALIMVVPAYKLGRRDLWLKGSALAVGGMVAFVVLFPNNYFVWSAKQLWTALSAVDASLLNVSAMNMVYNTLGPFLTVGSSLTSVGYGLGGTSVHLESMVPAVAQDAILEVTWEGMPTLGNLFGRIFAEVGAVGLLLFLAMWFVAAKQLRALEPRMEGRGLRLDRAAWIALVGILAGYVIKHGSFTIPFFWFWLAYVDARYLDPAPKEG